MCSGLIALLVARGYLVSDVLSRKGESPLISTMMKCERAATCLLGFLTALAISKICAIFVQYGVGKHIIQRSLASLRKVFIENIC